MNRTLRIVVLCVVMGAVGFGVGTGITGHPPEALASPLPTSSLQIQSHTYANGTVANSIVGSLTHAAVEVETWHVFIWSTPPGGVEGLSGGAETQRADGETTGVTAAVSLNQFTPGTVVRGQFTSKDVNGNGVYTQNITLAVP